MPFGGGGAANGMGLRFRLQQHAQPTVLSIGAVRSFTEMRTEMKGDNKYGK
jgi:hypothetical protein